MREWSSLKSAVFESFRLLLARIKKVGARTLVASVEAGKESHGWYMDDCRKGR